MHRKVTLGCALAAALWTLMGLLILAGSIVVFASEGHGRAMGVAMSLMAHGLICAAGAATLSVRNMLAGQNRLILDAFQLGQDYTVPTTVSRLKP